VVGGGEGPSLAVGEQGQERAFMCLGPSGLGDRVWAVCVLGSFGAGQAGRESVKQAGRESVGRLRPCSQTERGRRRRRGGGVTEEGSRGAPGRHGS
jgi:hypothetical protein